MSSIGQGPTQTDQAQASGNIANQPVDYSDKSVRRGYSDQNSYSRVEAEEAAKSQQPKPRLDNPAEGSYSDAAQKEVLKDFQETQEKPVSEFLREEGKELLKKGLEEGIKNAEKQVAELSSEKKTKTGDVANLGGKGKTGKQAGSTSTAGAEKNPASVPTESATATAAANTAAAKNASAAAEAANLDIPTVDEWDKLAAVFEDVYVKAGSIKEAPSELKEQIQAELASFTQKALSGKQTLDVDSATTMLMAIQSKLQDNRIKYDQETIKIKQVEYDQKFKESIADIREQIAKVKKAKASSLLSKIFGWIAVVVMVIITVVVAVVGAVFTGGALTALSIGLLIAATSIVLTMQVSSEVGSTWMMDMFGDSKDGKIGAMAFWTALIVALSLGAAAAGGAAGGAAGASAATNTAASATSTGATVTATAANTAATTSSVAAKVTTILNKLTKVLQLISGAAMIADGSAQIATSVYTHDAEMARAEAMENRAFMLRIQQAIDDATEALAQAIEELQAGYQVAANIIKADHETKTNLLSKLKA